MNPCCSSTNSGCSSPCRMQPCMCAAQAMKAHACLAKQALQCVMQYDRERYQKKFKLEEQSGSLIKLTDTKETKACCVCNKDKPEEDCYHNQGGKPTQVFPFLTDPIEPDTSGTSIGLKSSYMDQLAALNACRNFKVLSCCNCDVNKSALPASQSYVSPTDYSDSSPPTAVASQKSNSRLRASTGAKGLKSQSSFKTGNKSSREGNEFGFRPCDCDTKAPALERSRANLTRSSGKCRASIAEMNDEICQIIGGKPVAPSTVRRLSANVQKRMKSGAPSPTRTASSNRSSQLRESTRRNGKRKSSRRSTRKSESDYDSEVETSFRRSRSKDHDDCAARCPCCCAGNCCGGGNNNNNSNNKSTNTKTDADIGAKARSEEFLKKLECNLIKNLRQTIVDCLCMPFNTINRSMQRICDQTSRTEAMLTKVFLTLDERLERQEKCMESNMKKISDMGQGINSSFMGTQVPCCNCGKSRGQGPPANEADNFSQQASRTSYKGQLNACPRFCNNGNQTSNINNQGGRESAAFHVAVDNGNGVENSFKDPSNSIENCNCPSPNANQNSRVSYSFNDTSNVYAVSQIQTASPFKRCYSPNAQNSPKYQQSESSRSSHYLPTSPSHCSRDYMGEAIQTRNKKTAFMSEINLNVPPKYCHCDRKYCCCNATGMSSRSIPNMNSPHVFPDKSCPSFGLDYECKPTNRLPGRMLDPAKKHYEVCEQMGPGENPAFYHRAFEQLQSSASCEDSRTGMSLPTNDDCSCRNSDKELQDSNKS